jgi:DNA-binding MarR family transcriptional regulator
MNSTITIRKNKGDPFLMIVGLILDKELTPREMQILRTLTEMQSTKLDEHKRKELCTRMGISRENLNNMLIRMIPKGVFDKDWNLNCELLPLMQLKSYKHILIHI